MSFFEDLLGGVFGQKPDVPALKELNLSDEQLKAIEANLRAAPQASKLSELTADEIDRLMMRQFPNLDAVRGTVSRNLASMTKGELPDDVVDYVRRKLGAEALQGGYGGTGMHMNATARDLGLTSLELALKGQSATESWMAASERLYSPALATYVGSFLTPMQQAAFDVEERNTQFQHSWLKNQIKAMPDPILRGIHDTIMSLAVAYLGGNYTPQNPQQNYAAAGSGMGGGGDWAREANFGGGYGTPGGSPGDWAGETEAGQADWNAFSPGVGGAESAPAGAGIGAEGMGGFSMMGGFGGYCWVAREVYGETDFRWKMFRNWLTHSAPRWFFNLYLKYGARFARWIKDKPRLKAVIRGWMDTKIYG